MVQQQLQQLCHNLPFPSWPKRRGQFKSRVLHSKLPALSKERAEDRSPETGISRGPPLQPYALNHGPLPASHRSPLIPADGDVNKSLCEDAIPEYNQFQDQFPEYRETWPLDRLRETDFTRFSSSSETYLDYCGGCLHPESLVRVHSEFMLTSLLGNTHSVSHCSQLSSQCTDDARRSVLEFFSASLEYTVVFTANASAALKLVGESFPFEDGSAYILGVDSHNSLNGIRQFAMMKGATTAYIPSTPIGGFNPDQAKVILEANVTSHHPCLFAMTGLSNISNSKPPLETLLHASTLGFFTLLDAAALAATSPFSLAEHPVDAMAISFYKMFGYPTGCGALIIKKSLLSILERPWFAGGNVEIVQVPGTIVTRSSQLHERFEDGTINYLAMPAITTGLRFLREYLPLLQTRLHVLLQYLCRSLQHLCHEGTNQPVVKILSRQPSSSSPRGECGSLISMLFYWPSGEILSNSFIEWAAVENSISLRTGCMCNPGGATALLGVEDVMEKLEKGVKMHELEESMGRELGVIRVSLGLASNFADVRTFVQFVRLLSSSKKREILVERWHDAR
ncbi:pyridoxal phosphate-dependent transferase [Flagelloscypha sp. PMI_526]|nr:pyridoxal phosphate-dependent transferase [Flagelloscypha sp. PMI_526]